LDVWVLIGVALRGEERSARFWGVSWGVLGGFLGGSTASSGFPEGRSECGMRDEPFDVFSRRYVDLVIVLTQREGIGIATRII
jgi:hypothetical protein